MMISASRMCSAQQSHGGQAQLPWHHGEHDRVAEFVDDGAELEVVGTEVVSPLADAVRFIDNEQGRVCLA